MNIVNKGLPPEALEYLKAHAAPVGRPCWCCGLPIRENPMSYLDIPELQYTLQKWILKSGGLIAYEEPQRTIVKDGVIKCFFRLHVKPDGILAFGDGRLIVWPDNEISL